MAVKKIKFKGNEIPIRISWKDAMFTFKDMGLNLLKLFEDGSALYTIMADDEVMVELWYHYVSKHTTTLESAIEDVDEDFMHEFKEAFWEAVLDFTNPQMRPMLLENRKLIMQELASPGESLKKRYSESLQELEQTPTTSASGSSS
jgi:hypothetical protein